MTVIIVTLIIITALLSIPIAHALVLAAVGGLGAALAFAPFGWAPGAVLAVAVLTWCTQVARSGGSAKDRPTGRRHAWAPRDALRRDCCR